MFSSNTTQVSGGYEIQRSLRFNSADSTFLNRTPASATNRRTWTWSGWVKRSNVGTGSDRVLFSAYLDNSNRTDIRYAYTNNAQIGVLSSTSGTTDLAVNTSAMYRDPSAWYHIVVAMDTTQATGSDRVKIYVNGVLQSVSFGTTPSQNAQLNINTTYQHRIGALDASNYFDGYLTEVNFIDGQALTPSSFGAFDAQTGVWGPTRYGGSYGTNGFYLNFSNNSNTTAATLGADYSGNSNNWTPNNFSVSAGSGNDSLVDSPTSYGTDTGVGGTVRGNYCTLNPLNASSSLSISNGNLSVTTSASAAWYAAASTMAMSAGEKYYWEVTVAAVTSAQSLAVGIADASLGFSANAFIGQSALSWGYLSFNGNKTNSGSETAYGSAWQTAGVVVGVAFDAGAGTLTFYRNNVSQGTAFTGLTSGPYVPAVSLYPFGSPNPAIDVNFGQRPFAYTAPSGFRALNTQNLPTPTIGATTATQAGKFFNPVLYTGNGTTNNITGVGFQPDWTWVKARSTTTVTSNHFATDVVRGAGIGLYPNLTDAEANNTSLFTGFTSNGFNVAGTNSSLNENGIAYVGWNWKANGAGVTNTAGTITSTVSANTTSGFSVVTYTGAAGSAVSGTVGHGLGVAPSMIIVKTRNTVDGWYTYHASVGNTAFLELNFPGAAIGFATMWNNTNPTSSVFSTTYLNQGSRTYVAYCFSEVPGYSRFGSYTGNGSTDGPFVFCGFRPAYVMYKRTDTTSSWSVLDATRSPSNAANLYLIPDSSSAEVSGGTGDALDFLSNGFKVRATGTGTNASGGTYIFAAFASAPQKFSLAR